ncbi:bifunctional nuclease family protein [Sphingobacterium sp. SRCM116780]|uniref:bifunctional nuclease family protein n=1 Tax=Sphingobacterium sp. SRCM116780 TaxID=2907623 RepID=UPI001F28EC17|nr:bifunctional nuclease family protein [Sphingobacterium sp. SRCM116780]UIR56514.1 bifunctional nuclease family protein [Sphingobacterium sp. SRCM116780]
MKKIKLDIVGLSYSQTQSGAYALVLGESGGNRRLPIIIGSHEAQAIAIRIEKMIPSRPLTHDLFQSFAESFHINFEEVLIYNLIEGIFYAKIICSDGDKVVEIDARTSDAVALAVRFGAPIYTYDFILASAGIVIEGNEFAFLDNLENAVKGEIVEDEIKQEATKKAEVQNPFSSLTDEQLKTVLNQSLIDENYEQAALIRDEISRRK